MTFTSLPEMFSSVFDPLAYTFSNAAETELFLEILSTRDGSRIGSKRFYNTPTGTLNIAPMVRKNIRFVPSSGMTGFCNSESRSASVQLAAGTIYSEVRTFVAAHDSVKPSRILTTMPSHRIIAYGESDEITCCIPGTAHRNGHERHYGRSSYVQCDRRGGADPLPAQHPKFSALGRHDHRPDRHRRADRSGNRLHGRSEMRRRMPYRLAKPCRFDRTLHFSGGESVVQKIRKEQVLTDDAGYEDISIRDERTTTLASAFEPAAVIEALAEIAASPQVWKIDGDKYEEVDILTREQTIGRHGSLGCIEISLRPRQETRCL